MKYSEYKKEFDYCIRKEDKQAYNEILNSSLSKKPCTPLSHDSQ